MMRKSRAYPYTFTFNGETMMQMEIKLKKLVEEIEKRYKPLDWIDITLYKCENRASIGFTNTAKKQSDLKFFNECRQIKDFINSHDDFNAELIEFESDCDCPYAEAIINFTLDGSEL